MASLIEARNLTKKFGPIEAVKNLSFSVEKGEVLGLLGPNGAGKSTTMKMLTGYLTPDSGAALIADIDVVEDPLRAKSRFGYLAEGAPSYGDMRVVDFLQFIARSRGFTGQIDDAVQALQLENVLSQSIDTLSKGFRRRVGLAQAILHDPDVLILDEPTDGLDPNQKHEVRLLIERMAPEKAIIISTHVLEEVEALCTRAIIIDHGEIVADGTPVDLKSQSRYFGAVHITLDKGYAAQGYDVFAAWDDVSLVRMTHLSEAHARLSLFPNDRAVLLDKIRGYVGDKGWVLHHISVDSGRLDDVFRTLTTGDRADEGEAA